MSTPDPTGARAETNVLGRTAMPPAAGPPPEDSEFVLWPHTGRESVYFYPPGSLAEHLVIEHGIDSADVYLHSMGVREHAREHAGEARTRMGEIGDLLAVGHAHEEAA